MFVSIDTDIPGAVIEAAALAQVNVWDCLRRPDLCDELFRRIAHPRGCRYRRENMDEWSTAAAERWRDEQRRKGVERQRRALDTLCAAGLCGLRGGSAGEEELEPWAIDCEEGATLGAAAAILLAIRRPELRRFLEPVEVCITQPREHGVAHAYTRIAGKVLDLSVKFGMGDPLIHRPNFYDLAETAAMVVTIPKFSIWLPRR